MAFTAVAAVGVGVSAWGAYNSKKQGDRMSGLASQQAAWQDYYSRRLVQLLDNPAQILNDPGFRASFNLGTEAVSRSLAARGFLDSGNAVVELQQFGQSFGQDYLVKQQQLLASLSGAQFNPAGAGAAAQNSYDSAFNQAGDALSSLGYMFGGSGFGGGLGPGGRIDESGWGGPTSVPGTMNAGGGYIYNVPGRGP